MKHSFRCGGLLVILVFLIAISQTSARFLQTKQGEKMVGIHESINGSEGFLVDTENSNSMNELMGMEDCGSGDEECLKRRVVAEAHLDYIYTQHHKP